MKSEIGNLFCAALSLSQLLLFSWLSLVFHFGALDKISTVQRFVGADQLCVVSEKGTMKVDYKEITEMIKIADKEGTGVVKFEEVGVRALWLLDLVKVNGQTVCLLLNQLCLVAAAAAVAVVSTPWVSAAITHDANGIGKMENMPANMVRAEFACGCSCGALPRSGFSKKKAN